MTATITHCAAMAHKSSPGSGRIVVVVIPTVTRAGPKAAAGDNRPPLGSSTSIAALAAYAPTPQRRTRSPSALTLPVRAGEPRILPTPYYASAALWQSAHPQAAARELRRR